MEGIMMRGPKKTYLAVRNPQGEMVIEEVPPKEIKHPKLRKIPFVRGIFSFVDSMMLGYKALMRSVAQAAAEITALVQEGTGEAGDMLEAAEQKIFSIRRGMTSTVLSRSFR